MTYVYIHQSMMKMLMVLDMMISFSLTEIKSCDLTKKLLQQIQFPEPRALIFSLASLIVISLEYAI